MLEQILAYLRNYFVVGYSSGTFEVKGGVLLADFLKEGQYFKISGSVFNDGTYKFPEAKLIDETFSGSVYALAIPKSLIDLVAEIEEWEKANKSATQSPYQAESFGGYSYTLKGGAEGFGATWQSVFAQRLNIWRKI